MNFLFKVQIPFLQVNSISKTVHSRFKKRDLPVWRNEARSKLILSRNLKKKLLLVSLYTYIRVYKFIKNNYFKFLGFKFYCLSKYSKTELNTANFSVSNCMF